MIPKSKGQKRVISLLKYLPDINTRQLRWGKNQFEKYVFVRKDTLTCFECGHTWDAKYYNSGDYKCPKCKTQLKRWDEKTTKGYFTRKYKDYWLISVFTTIKEFQVLRYFRINKYCKVSIPAEFVIHEIYQHWISNTGKRYLVSRLMRPFNSWCFDPYNYSSELEIRYIKECHLVEGIPLYPYRRLLPELIRNGFYDDYYKIHPSNLFMMLLGDPIAETLLKSQQISLLQYYEKNQKSIKARWPSIKICIRNNYNVYDANTWIDQLRLLEQFGKDLHNPLYVCPKNLRKEHQKYIGKAIDADNKEKAEKLKLKIDEDNKLYKKLKRKYFKLKFTNKEITVAPLKSVQEFYDEGKYLHHCVFVNQYYKRDKSLILSARKGKERLETLELYLPTMKIEQCRGTNNQNSEYHNDIINLVKSNIKTIKQLANG